MRYIFTLLVICFVSFTSFAQTDFDDLFESMKSNDRFSNVLHLRYYQKEKPEHAIAYYLLGDAFDKYMRETDPLKYFFNLNNYYQQANTCYGLAKGKLDQKQARADREYFGEIKILDGDRKVDYEDIIFEIEKRLKSLEDYYQNASKVNDFYVRFVNKYNECLFGFRNILGYYPYYKDLCLLANPAQIKSIEKIGANFEESLSYFNSYSAACKTLPYFSKIPVSKLKPIITYRLEGLVESDYSAPLVELWDYKTWANDFVNVIDKDIKTIRDELISTDTKLDAQIKKLQENEFYSDELNVFKSDERFKFLIGKYDYNSLSNKLLNYKESKIDFLKFSRSKINDPMDTTETYLINRLTFYKDLALKLNALNSEASDLEKSVTIAGVEKYNDFYETRYQGMDRFIRWCNAERFNNTKTFNKNLKNLDLFLKREEEKYDYKGIDAVYLTKKLALGVQHQNDALKPDQLITQKFMPFAKSTYYLSGIEVGKDSLAHPFIAQADTSRNVRWFVSPHFQKEKDEKSSVVVSEMKLLDDSTLLILFHKQHKSPTGLKFQNYVAKYDWKGKELSRMLIDTLGVPQFFYYDDISDEYFLATKQDLNKDTNNGMEQLNCHLLAGNGDEKWIKQFSIKGNLVDVVLTNSNYFVFVNASNFFNRTDFQFDGKGETSALGIYINHDGSIKGHHQFNCEGGLVLSSVLKVNSNNLSLIGKHNPKIKNENVFLLISPDGEIVFKNKDEIQNSFKP
jgi:hypothetical protein